MYVLARANVNEFVGMEVDPPRRSFLPRVNINGVNTSGFNTEYMKRSDLPTEYTTGLKYFDTVCYTRTIERTEQNWTNAGGCVLDPNYAIHSLRSDDDGNVPNPGTLFAPQLMYPIQPEDNDEIGASRCGDKVDLYCITVRGEVFRESTYNMDINEVQIAGQGGVVRLLLVQDSQTNREQLKEGLFQGAENVMDDTLSIGVGGIVNDFPDAPTIYTSLQAGTLGRFEILDQKFFTVPSVAPTIYDLPITLTPEVVTAWDDPGFGGSTSGTAVGTVGLVAGTGGPIDLVTENVFTGQIAPANTTGTISGLARPKFALVGYNEPFEFFYQFPVPKRIQFKAVGGSSPNQSTGTIADLPTVSFHIIGGVNQYPDPIFVRYWSRCWFRDA